LATWRKKPSKTRFSFSRARKSASISEFRKKTNTPLLLHALNACWLELDRRCLARCCFSHHLFNPVAIRIASRWIILSNLSISLLIIKASEITSGRRCKLQKTATVFIIPHVIPSCSDVLLTTLFPFPSFPIFPCPIFLSLSLAAASSHIFHAICII
jgi:hypothetical protein